MAVKSPFYALQKAIFESERTPKEKLLLLAMTHYGKNGTNMWPKVEWLAAMTGMGPSTVRRLLHGLRADKVLVADSSLRPGYAHGVRYHFGSGLRNLISQRRENNDHLISQNEPIYSLNSERPNKAGKEQRSKTYVRKASPRAQALLNRFALKCEVKRRTYRIRQCDIDKAETLIATYADADLFNAIDNCFDGESDDSAYHAKKGYPFALFAVQIDRFISHEPRYATAEEIRARWKRDAEQQGGICHD